ncbi:MAG TPA: MFS transporter [Gemmatales bacterium]|nr:MFS transporter [Gemmatales bacterium]
MNPPAATTRPTHVRYQVMAFLLTLSFLTYFDRFCIVRVQQEIQLQLTITDAQMGYILGAFWLAYSLFEIPGGWLGDRFGARLTLTRVVFFWSLFTVLTGLATGFISLLIIRFLFGVGEAGAFPNMARVQASWLPAGARGRAGGMLWLAARWGGAFSPFLFAALIRWLDSATVRPWLTFVPGLAGIPGWRIGFWIAGLVGFIWCVWFYYWFKDDPAEKTTVNNAELELILKGGGPDPHAGHRVPFRTLWRDLIADRSLLALVGFYFFGSFGWSFFASWMPKYLDKVHHLPFDASESVWKQPLLYGGISCLLGGVLSDWLVRRTGRKWLGRALFPFCGLSMAAIATFCVPYVRSADEAVILMCIAGAAFDFGQGATWASIVDIGGLFAGTAAGFINMFGNLGNAIQPRVGAWIFNSFGWDPLFVVYSGAFLASALMWFWINPAQPFHAPVNKDNSC